MSDWPLTHEEQAELRHWLGSTDVLDVDAATARVARSIHKLMAALAARDEENHALRAALEVADREASVAHDAIWDDTVRSGLDGTGFEVLHDSALHTSADAAICRLHDTVRSALAVSRPAQTDTEETRT